MLSKNLTGVIDDRYRILSHLGDGGMGIVFKAEEQGLGRVVALKLLHSSLIGDSESLMRFQREGKLLANLSHRHILTFYRFGLWKELYPYIAMEHLEGKSLKALENDDGEKLAGDFPRLIKIASQVLDALGYLHSSGVVHRDLTPNNIMISDEPEVDFVKLLDFGLARFLIPDAGEQRLTKTGILIGSVSYMSPEQASGKAADQRSDIYSFGCILYEMIVGAPPLVADNPIGLMHKHINEQALSFSKALPKIHVPAGLEAIVFKCMAKDPDSRYQSAEAVLADLSSVQLSAGSAGLNSYSSNSGEKKHAGVQQQKLDLQLKKRNAFILLASVVLLLLATTVYLMKGEQMILFMDTNLFIHGNSSMISKILRDAKGLEQRGEKESATVLYVALKHELELRREKSLELVEVYNRLASLRLESKDIGGSAQCAEDALVVLANYSKQITRRSSNQTQSFWQACRAAVKVLGLCMESGKKKRYSERVENALTNLRTLAFEKEFYTLGGQMAQIQISSNIARNNIKPAQFLYSHFYGLLVKANEKGVDLPLEQFEASYKQFVDLQQTQKSKVKELTCLNDSGIFLGLQLLNVGAFDRCEAIMNLLLSSNPDANPIVKCSALNNLAATYSGRQNPEKAIEHYKDALALFENGEVKSNIALPALTGISTCFQICSRNNELMQLLDLMQRKIDSASDDSSGALAWYTAVLYRDTGEQQKAEKLFEEILRKKSTRYSYRVAAFTCLLDCLLYQRKFERAESVLASAKENLIKGKILDAEIEYGSAPDAVLKNGEAKIRMAQGDWRKGASLLKQVLRAHPSNNPVYIQSCWHVYFDKLRDILRPHKSEWEELKAIALERKNLILRDEKNDSWDCLNALRQIVGDSFGLEFSKEISRDLLVLAQEKRIRPHIAKSLVEDARIAFFQDCKYSSSKLKTAQLYFSDLGAEQRTFLDMVMGYHFNSENYAEALVVLDELAKQAESEEVQFRILQFKAAALRLMGMEREAISELSILSRAMRKYPIKRFNNDCDLLGSYLAIMDHHNVDEIAQTLNRFDPGRLGPWNLEAEIRKIDCLSLLQRSKGLADVEKNMKLELYRRFLRLPAQQILQEKVELNLGSAHTAARFLAFRKSIEFATLSIEGCPPEERFPSHLKIEAQARAIRGEMIHFIGKTAEGILDWHKALELSPNSNSEELQLARQRLLWDLARRGLKSEAEEFFKQNTGNNTNGSYLAAMNTMLADLYYASGDYVKAEEYYKKAALVYSFFNPFCDESGNFIRFRLAATELKLKKFADAERHLKQCVLLLRKGTAPCDLFWHMVYSGNVDLLKQQKRIKEAAILEKNALQMPVKLNWYKDWYQCTMHGPYDRP